VLVLHGSDDPHVSRKDTGFKKTTPSAKPARWPARSCWCRNASRFFQRGAKSTRPHLSAPDGKLGRQNLLGRG
jgi:hypothetical protein